MFLFMFVEGLTSVENDVSPPATLSWNAPGVGLRRRTLIVGAFILTYNRPQHLRAAIEFLLDQTVRPDRLLVVDNANQQDTADVVAEFHSEGFEYHATSANLGSAGGVATGLELMAEMGCDWIISVDDDDTPPKGEHRDTVSNLIELIKRNDDGMLGIVGAIGSRFDWKSGEHVRIPDRELTGDIDVDIVGGGSFLTVSRRVLDDIGPPNKDFFFGHYDPLFCLEAKRKGYGIMVDGDGLLSLRASGDRLDLVAQRKTLVARNPYHSLWRRYYVTRNYIYAMRHTFDEPRLARRMALKSSLQSILSFGRGLRYGWRYATMQLRGIVDGYRGRLGPTIAPVAKPVSG